MNNERLSLLSNIQHIFNGNQVGSADFELARYFLQNYVNISKLNINEVADQNHVSRATVRRFCEHLGYENFKNLKSHFEDFNEGIEKYRKFYSGNDFRSQLVSQSVYMMRELSERMNTPEKNAIIKAIFKAEGVFIFSSSRISSSICAFQQEMVNFGLTIYVADNQDDIDLLESQITKKSLIIIFSITGVFVNSISNSLGKLSCKKMLFTLKRDVLFNRQFDKVYNLRGQENQRVNDQLYYTYGIDFVLDILFKDYLDYIYKKEEE
ncbi:MurR/RpiR family transcriptional regulator [Pediococcus inopinatus]|uniref:MurR/RpiR family transcriptional regulator n=1 Tax=Pediococcus inopinatus TaxID=114090 RepID=UPI002B26059C|nr:MurR/RpiR family transcriptional regulator [Pediococcus inopinatus]WPC18293.1 MurR/RpiR family transcriptional regulator [Pediococcus inopinatus]